MQAVYDAVACRLIRQAVAVAMSQADALLQSAVESHRQGRLSEAVHGYQQLAEANPTRADILGLWGTALRQLERHEDAVAVLARAVSLDATQPSFFGNLGEAYRNLGKLDDAIDCYAQAARLAPFLADVHSTLGALLQEAGRLEEADAALAQALRCDPRHAAALYNRGNLLQSQKQWDDAVASYRQAVEASPDYVDAMCNLGNALRELRRPDEARQWLERALALAPDCVPAISNLGVVLQDLGHSDQALGRWQRAIELEPDRAALHVNLGTAYKDVGESARAMKCYETALALAPNDPQVLLSRGTALLATGNLAEGWAGYEHRVDCEQFDTRDLPQPRWQGEPLDGRTLFVHAEQGLGDTLQFIRFTPQATQYGGKVIVAVQPVLVSLLRASGFENVVASTESPEPFDVHVPLMSLPYVFKTELDTIPNNVPYLEVEPERIAAWETRISGRRELNVGVVWQGRPDHRRDRSRSFRLDALAPLAAVPGVRLFSLQKGPGIEQLTPQWQQQNGVEPLDIVDLGESLDNDGPVFMDTAAAMKCLDLVVAPDTGVAHLAGGLGVKVWVALPLGAEWRWMTDRDDSPWYPTMRLFRQRRLGDWADVFARMAIALEELRKP